jgi:type III secretion protein L
VKRKYFTLIRGDTIQLAPEAKVLPSEEFSTLLDAKEMLQKVKEDAEAYKLKVQAEAEQLKIDAQKEGFAEGFKAWGTAVAALESHISQVQTDIQKTLAPIALKAAKKIVGREIELSEDTIVDIVSNSLKAVSQHHKITIYVNKKELAILEANRPRLRDIFESLQSLSIRERSDIAPGGCIIETEGGIINAQLDNQWRVLEKAFETLLKQYSTAH